MDYSLLIVGILIGSIIGVFLGKLQIYFGTEEIIEKRQLYENAKLTIPIGVMLLIKRTYKSGASRIIKKKIMF